MKRIKINNALEQRLFANKEQKSIDVSVTYAVIDSAMDDDVYLKIQAEAPQQRILLDGEEAEAFEAAAPYLVQLNKGDKFTQWVFDEIYAHNAALFIKSTQDIDSLAEHLKAYVKIQMPIEDLYGEVETQWVYFAFYDPRVFPDFIESNTAEQNAEFFQEIDECACESADDKFEFNSYQHSPVQKTVIHTSTLLDKKDDIDKEEPSHA